MPRNALPNPQANMLMPEVINTLLNKFTPIFPAINGDPSNNDFTLLREHITNLLQDINIPSDKYILSDFVEYDFTYRATYGHLFNRMYAALKDYDPTIGSGKKDGLQAKAERQWASKLDLQRRIKAADCGERSLILTTVEDTRV